MTHINKTLRLGPTALAAVLALSATSAFAQDAAPPVVTVPTPAPPVATQVAPAAPVVRELRAPAMEPVVTMPTEASETRASAEPRRASVATRQAPAVSRIRSAAAEAPAVAAAPTVATGPVEAPAVAEAPLVAPAVPLAAEPVAAPVESASGGTDVLPIAGGAAALLALAGGAYALSRRRRGDEQDAVEAETWDADHVAYAEPAEPETPAAAAWAAPEPVTAAPIVAPVVAATAVPAGMDLSRFGRHAQAAYAGPTPDNPSLSLKRRLKRAAFFDQRERMALEAGATPEVAAPVVARAEPVQAPRRPVTVTSRRVAPQASTQALFGFRPAFQS